METVSPHELVHTLGTLLARTLRCGRIKYEDGRPHGSIFMSLPQVNQSAVLVSLLSLSSLLSRIINGRLNSTSKGMDAWNVFIEPTRVGNRVPSYGEYQKFLTVPYHCLLFTVLMYHPTRAYQRGKSPQSLGQDQVSRLLHPTSKAN